MDASDINTEDNRSLREKFRDYVPEKRQSTECNDDINIMVYANIEYYRNGKQVRITEVINDIRNKSERQNIKNKNKLSVGYFSVSMFNGRKADENVTQHSGLIIIDIDKKDNPDIDFIQLKKDLQSNKITYACFNSPSGGIKLIVNTNIKAIEHHDAYYESIRDYLLAEYTITKIDTSGSNVARACYLPYDYYCYYNPHSYRYCLDANQIDKLINNIHINKNIHNLSKSIHQVNSISLDEHYDNILNLLKKRTETGLYTNIFNDFRYNNLEGGIMDSSVPFLELIVLKNIYPYHLNWETRLDEYYFRNNPQKQINVINIGCHDGLETCKIGFRKTYVFKEHYRAKTLGSISMKLIFNNPFCHPDYLINLMIKINDTYCEDPHPKTNPKPDDAEVRKIVLDNYNKYLSGTLDFSTVVQKNLKKDMVSKKYVFKSLQYLSIDKSITHLEAVRTFHEGKNTINMKRFEESICVLQDGKKITQKRIAEHLGVSTRTIRRYMTEKYSELVVKYNETLKLHKRGSKFH